MPTGVCLETIGPARVTGDRQLVMPAGRTRPESRFVREILIKPFDIERLLTTVKGVLGRRTRTT